MKKLLAILSLGYLNTVPNSKKSTQIKTKAQTLNFTQGKRKEFLQNEIALLQKHLKKESENSNNSPELIQTLEHAIYSLEQNLRRFK